MKKKPRNFSDEEIMEQVKMLLVELGGSDNLNLDFYIKIKLTLKGIIKGEFHNLRREFFPPFGDEDLTEMLKCMEELEKNFDKDTQKHLDFHNKALEIFS